MDSPAPSWPPVRPSLSPIPGIPTLPTARNSTFAWMVSLPVSRTAILERSSTPTASSATFLRMLLNGEIIQIQWKILLFIHCLDLCCLQRRLVPRSSIIHRWFIYSKVQHPVKQWPRLNKNCFYCTISSSKKKRMFILLTVFIRFVNTSLLS